MDYYFNKREGEGGVRVHIWIITLISGRWGGGGGKSTYLDYYFNKREGEGADKSTYLDYYFNKREEGMGIRVHNWIITLISGRGGG